MSMTSPSSDAYLLEPRATSLNGGVIICNTLQHAATRCNTMSQRCVRLQHTATYCNTLQRIYHHLRHAATHCDMLQWRCNDLHILPAIALCNQALQARVRHDEFQIGFLNESVPWWITNRRLSKWGYIRLQICSLHEAMTWWITNWLHKWGSINERHCIVECASGLWLCICSPGTSGRWRWSWLPTHFHADVLMMDHGRWSSVSVRMIPYLSVRSWWCRRVCTHIHTHTHTYRPSGFRQKNLAYSAGFREKYLACGAWIPYCSP